MLSYRQEPNTGIQCQIARSQPPTNIDKLNRQLTRGDIPFYQDPGCRAPPDMEHPHHQLPKQSKRSVCQPEKTRVSPRGTSWSYGVSARYSHKMATWGCPPNMHHFNQRLGSRLATSMSSSIQLYKTIPQKKKAQFFSPKKKLRGNKKTLPLEIGGVVTVANAVPRPRPVRESAPPGRMDADYCDDVPS